jgi:hypothetical protein
LVNMVHILRTCNLDSELLKKVRTRVDPQLLFWVFWVGK